MNTTFKDGKIITAGQYFEESVYNIANNRISVKLDGKGAIIGYAVIGEKTYYDNYLSMFKLTVDGRALGFDTEKTVEMVGRTQRVILENDDLCAETKLFLTPDDPCVYQRVTVRKKHPCRVDCTVFLKNQINNERVERGEICSFRDETGLYFASDLPFAAVWQNSAFLFEMPDCDEISFNMVWSYQEPDVKLLCARTVEAEQMADAEIAAVKIPASAASEKDRAQYLNTYFCALENYKDMGDFKGFMAGCSYVAPARTYYRDSYFTVLPMYNGQTDKVRNEILTLAKGISEDGNCPSAVITDFSPWWGQHYDSPSMFCMMLYDYVNNTGDRGILEEVVGRQTIFEAAERVLLKLAESCDHTGLIVKEGKYNLRDWADEVNRTGYVTYIEALFARALYCMSLLLQETAPARAADYAARFERVKQAINDILWDDLLGYYVNYKNEHFTEANLSIDTVPMLLFGIAEGERAERMLDACQILLESRTHSELEDFGTLCVYPPYSGIESACQKSARPLDYHNGADWPYWSAMYAYALKMFGRDFTYPLTRWFDVNLEKGNFTPIEYFSPYCKDGSLLQAWSGTSAFVYWDENCQFFKNKL